MHKNTIKSYYVDVDVWESLQTAIQYSIKCILKSVMVLIHNAKSAEIKFYPSDICGGLYTYAIEEYGKLLILQSYKPSDDGKVEINKFNEFRDHRIKITKAFEVLPEACKLLSSGGFTVSGFTESGFTHDKIANFDNRKAIFFSEMDRKTGKVRIAPYVNENTIENAVSEFQQFTGIKF